MTETKARIKNLEKQTKPDDEVKIHVVIVDRCESDDPEVIQVEYLDEETKQYIKISQAEYWRKFPERQNEKTIVVKYGDKDED